VNWVALYIFTAAIAMPIATVAIRNHFASRFPTLDNDKLGDWVGYAVVALTGSVIWPVWAVVFGVAAATRRATKRWQR
jgi:hypothetical protein